MRKKWIPFLLSLGTLLVSCSEEGQTLKEKKEQIKQYRQQKQKLEKKINSLEKAIAAKETPKKEKDYQLVSLEPVKEHPFQHYVKLRGQASTDENVSISPERSGRIEMIHCEEGDQVKKGKLLVELDSETIERNIDQIETNLAHARKLYQKQKNLWDQDIGSEVEFLESRNRVNNLEKELKAAKSRLANTTIKAPINGKVDAIFMNTGEMANPASPLIRIVNLRQMEVTADPSEAYLDDVKPGDSVLVEFPNLDIEHKKTVTHVSSYIDPDTRTFEISVDIDNPNQIIKPNVLAQVRFADYSKSKAVTIPTKLMQSSDTGNYVYIARQKGGKQIVQRNYIQTGKSYQGITEVKSGLEPGQQLVTDGFRDVNQNQKVVTNK